MIPADVDALLDRHRGHIVRGLRRARSLKDACHNLRHCGGAMLAFSDALCFGLWDGWAKRPMSYDGLHPQRDHIDPDDAVEYGAAYQYGRHLRED